MLNAEKYKVKGWQKHEIIKANKILKKARNTKNKHVKNFEWALYIVFFALFLLLTLTLIIRLMPLMLITDHVAIYFLILIVGLGFGWLFGVVFSDLDHLKKKHHTTYALFSFVTGILLFGLLISSLSSEITAATNKGWILGLCYSIGFIVPHYYYNIKND